MNTSDSIKYHCKCFKQPATLRIVCIGYAMRNKRKKIASEREKNKSNDFLNGDPYVVCEERNEERRNGLKVLIK